MPFALRREHGAGFEQPHVGDIATPVVAERVEQAGQHRRSKHREFFRQRVRDGDKRCRAGDKRFGGNLLDECEGHGLLQARAAEQSPDAPCAQYRGVRAVRRCSKCGERRRHAIDAPVAADFFDQVRFAGHVHTPTRHAHEPVGVRGRDAKSQARENAHHVCIRDLVAEQAVQTRAQKDEIAISGRRWVTVCNPADATPRADALEQVQRAGQAGSGRLKVGAAFEPGGRFGLQPQPLAGGADGCRLEPRAFQRDAGGGRGDFRRGAAHDSGDGYRARAVSDDEH